MSSDGQQLKISSLGGTPSEWKIKIIGELAAPQANAIVDGPFGSNLKISDYVKTGVPVLQGSNITGDRFQLQDERFVSPSKAEELRRSFVQKGDLLVVKIGSVGYSAVIDDLGPYEKALIPANLLKASFDQRQVLTKFVHHYLTSQAGRRRLIDAASRTAQPALTLGRFKSLAMPIPPIREQRRIVEILNIADAAIRETERVIAKLRQVKQGLLHDLLTRGLDEAGHLRDPGAHPEQFKDSAVGKIPENWEITTLGDTIANTSGFIQTGPFGSQLHAEEYTKEGVPVIMPQDIHEGHISTEEIARIPLEKVNFLARHRVYPNDVIFARRGDLSRCAPISERESGWLCGTGCLLVRSPKGLLVGEWLASVYRHPSSQRQIYAKAVGSTMVNLNTKLLESLVIAKPVYEEQLAIAEMIDIHDARIRAEEEILAKRRQLKRGLMDDLLTGRVRV